MNEMVGDPMYLSNTREGGFSRGTPWADAFSTGMTHKGSLDESFKESSGDYFLQAGGDRQR